MNPGALRDGTMATFPSNVPIPSLISKPLEDLPPMTGSFMVVHVWVGLSKLSIRISSSNADADATTDASNTNNTAATKPIVAPVRSFQLALAIAIVVWYVKYSCAIITIMIMWR